MSTVNEGQKQLVARPIKDWLEDSGLGVAKGAEKLGVTRQAVYHYIRNGIPVCVIDGRLYRPVKPE
jgi:predicted XRE-type DNA-binding protein